MKTILSLSVAAAMLLAMPGKSQQNNNSDDGVYTAPSKQPATQQPMSPADPSVQPAPAPQPASPADNEQYA